MLKVFTKYDQIPNTIIVPYLKDVDFTKDTWSNFNFGQYEYRATKVMNALEGVKFVEYERYE